MLLDTDFEVKVFC